MSTERADDGIAAYVNRLDEAQVTGTLLRCCGSADWATQVAEGRPYASDAELFEVAERVWWSLTPDDWREAFAAHPRIGERGDEWSEAEQAGMQAANRSLRHAIRDGNIEYERRFGHVFLVCATDLSAPEMAARLSERLDNDAETELRTAAAEQAKITRLRLQKLLST